MNLGELRAQCAEELGRFDLVIPDTFADNGMDFKINAAMKVLDGMIPRPYNMKTKSFDLSLGDSRFGVLDLREPRYVYYLNDNGDKVMYEFIPMDWYIRQKDVLVSNDSRIKMVYAFESPSVSDDTDLGDGQLYIFLTPVLEADTTIYVSGDYFSNTLVADNDQNYWTEVHPQLCVWAVGYILEVSLRNTEGMRDWMNAMKQYLLTDRNYAADREYFDVSQMEG